MPNQPDAWSVVIGVYSRITIRILWRKQANLEGEIFVYLLQFIKCLDILEGSGWDNFSHSSSTFFIFSGSVQVKSHLL